MEILPGVFDFGALERAEHSYRTNLIKHPDNLEMRVRLAWCLFMQALYQSGQETMLKQMAQRNAPAESTEAFDASRILLDRDAQTLLQECLHQTFTVIQLSALRRPGRWGENSGAGDSVRHTGDRDAVQREGRTRFGGSDRRCHLRPDLRTGKRVDNSASLPG